MPHAILDVDARVSHSRIRKSKAPYRDNQKLFASLEHFQRIYAASELSQNTIRQLHASLKTQASPIKSIVSLGLGGFSVAKCQSRRLKQLTILLAIRTDLENLSATKIDVYAQDPSFTRGDEAFLTALNISILHTSSTTSLGEAAAIVSTSTLIYTPFLTLEVYEQLLRVAQVKIPVILGDDFNALLTKWPSRSLEHGQVEALTKKCLHRYKRRTIQGGGFWEEVDGSFPMALYDASEIRKVKTRARAKI
jgi:hypothetical protein